MNRTTRNLLRAAALAPAAVLLAMAGAPAHADAVDDLGRKVLKPVGLRATATGATAECAITADGVVGKVKRETGLRARDNGVVRCAPQPAEAVRSVKALNVGDVVRLSEVTKSVRSGVPATRRETGDNGLKKLLGGLDGTVRVTLPQTEAAGMEMRKADHLVPGVDAVGRLADSARVAASAAYPVIEGVANPALAGVVPTGVLPVEPALPTAPVTEAIPVKKVIPTTGRVAGGDPIGDLLAGLLGGPNGAVGGLLGGLLGGPTAGLTSGLPTVPVTAGTPVVPVAETAKSIPAATTVSGLLGGLPGLPTALPAGLPKLV